MLDYIKPFFGKLTTFAKQRMGFDRPPRLFLKQDKDNSSKVFGKTAFYDRDNESITIFVNGRHPKDILRSYAHELVHHAQNCRGDLQNTGKMDKNYAQNNKHMRNMEKEAYLVGNMCFRDFEDSLQDKEVHIIKLAESSFLKENKKVKTKITKEVLKEMIKETIGKVLSEAPQPGLKLRQRTDDTEELGSGAIGGLPPLPPEPPLTGRKQMTKRPRKGEKPQIANDGPGPEPSFGNLEFRPRVDQTDFGKIGGMDFETMPKSTGLTGRTQMTRRLKPGETAVADDGVGPKPGIGDMPFRGPTDSAGATDFGASTIKYDSPTKDLPKPDVQLTQRKQKLRKALEGGDEGSLADVKPTPAPEEKKANLDKTIIPFLKGFHANQYYGVMPNLESEGSFAAAYNFARNEYKVPYFHYGPNAKYEVYSTGLGRKPLTLSQMENIKKEYAAYAFDELMNNQEFFDDIAASLPQDDPEMEKRKMDALDNIPTDIDLDGRKDLEEKKKGKFDDGDGKDEKCDYVDCGDTIDEESAAETAKKVGKPKSPAAPYDTNESKIQTPEQENTLYEQRFTPKNNRLYEKLLKQWTK